jgi:hypothetical protein
MPDVLQCITMGNMNIVTCKTRFRMSLHVFMLVPKPTRGSYELDTPHLQLAAVHV